MQDTLNDKIKNVEEGFQNYLPKEEGYAKTLIQGVNYSVLTGGKRLRPLFMYEMYLMMGGTDERAIRPFMMAMEMIHTYSLVHDDLPAMDNDDYRRGQLSTHKKYGEAMGILVGDALLNMAFETAFQAFDSATDPACVGMALRVLGAKAGIRGMVGGQAVDVENNGCFVESDTLKYVYKNKTAALIEASLMIGAILAGADEKTVEEAEKMGMSIGIAFQVQDDLLDVEGEEKVTGKPVHSDAKNEKSTYTAIYGLAKSREKVAECTKQGLQILDRFTVKNEEERIFLRELMQSLVGRKK